MSKGRTKNSTRPIKLSLSLHPNIHRVLESFVPSGFYGSSKTEVASSILREWIRANAKDELDNSAMLIDNLTDNP